jgi:hypothetical protein
MALDAKRLRTPWMGIRFIVVLILAVSAVAMTAADEWTTGGTGRGTARWSVEAMKLTYRGGADFGWAVSGPPIADGFVETRFRPIGGRQDQAGGVVWRWQDANNYYIARANALENNVVAYKMVKGRRVDLKPVAAGSNAYGVKATVAGQAWHTLRVDFHGSEFTVRLDRDIATFTVRDGDIAGPGRVGVWSKADSETDFEEFRFAAR